MFGLCLRVAPDKEYVTQSSVSNSVVESEDRPVMAEIGAVERIIRSGIVVGHVSEGGDPPPHRLSLFSTSSNWR